MGLVVYMFISKYCFNCCTYWFAISDHIPLMQFISQLQLHHGRGPLPLYTHDHVGVVAADVAVEVVPVCVDEVVVVLHPEVAKDLTHGLQHSTVELGTLDRLERTDFLVLAAAL